MPDFGTWECTTVRKYIFKKAPVKTRNCYLTLCTTSFITTICHLPKTINSVIKSAFWSHRHFDWLGPLWSKLFCNSFLDRKSREHWERGDPSLGTPKNDVWFVPLAALAARLGILWYSGSLFRERPEVHNLASKVTDWREKSNACCGELGSVHHCCCFSGIDIRFRVNHDHKSTVSNWGWPLCLLLWDEGESQGNDQFLPSSTSPDYSWVQLTWALKDRGPA